MFSYEAAPYSFVVGGIALMIAFQLISLGTIALQSERYFKELFHFNTTLYRQLKQREADVSALNGLDDPSRRANRLLEPDDP